MDALSPKERLSLISNFLSIVIADIVNDLAISIPHVEFDFKISDYVFSHLINQTAYTNFTVEDLKYRLKEIRRIATKYNKASSIFKSISNVEIDD